MLNVDVEITHKDCTKVKESRNVGKVLYEMKYKRGQRKE